VALCGSLYRVQKFDSDGKFVTQWGSEGSGSGAFNHPCGIVADRNGFVYVADTDNHRIQKFSSDGEFVEQWGSQGSEDGEFYNPEGVAIDNGGFVYVTDIFNHRVQKFDSGGQFMTKWGAKGSGDGEFNDPDGMVIDHSGFVYVADAVNNRIQKFTDNGEFVSRWGRSSGNVEFNLPYGICVDDDVSGYVYVADTRNDRVQKFTAGGEYVNQWGGRGSEEGMFISPYDIATDSSGFIYVADSGNHRIQKFDSDGEFVLQWGERGTENGAFILPYGMTMDKDGFIYVADTGNDRIQKFTTKGEFVIQWGGRGSEDGEFISPSSVAADKNGFVFVADTGNDRIQKFSADGEYLTQWGSEEWPFDSPCGIEVGTDGFVYVTDTDNHRIQIFTSEGEFIAKWAEPGNYPGQMNYPCDLAVNADGDVYVADTYNHRIQIFKKAPFVSGQKAIIVAGGGPYPGNHLWPAIQMNANFAHRTLSYQGFTKKNIYYLSSDMALDLDNNGKPDDVYGEPTEENLRELIAKCATEDTDRLVIYLVDHGGEEVFLINGTANPPSYISASDLDKWLAQFGESIPTEVIVIYDACKSGSFLSSLTPSDDNGRIVITSTSHNEDAYFLNQGTLSFSNLFWTHIFKGHDIGDAFERTKKSLGDVTTFQNPRIRLSQDISSGICIGNCTAIRNDPPVIEGMSDSSISGVSFALLYASEVTDDDGIARVWAVILPPGYGHGLSGSTVLELPFVNLLPVGDGRYEGTYDKFNLEGIWQVVLCAKDRRGNTSAAEPAEITVTNPMRRKAVIVGGYAQSDEDKAVIRKSTNIAYNALRTQGYPDEDICFMGSDSSRNGWDMPATLRHLRNTLVSEEMRGNTLDVVLYLVGSGKSGGFYLNDMETLSAVLLDIRLDRLQDKMPGTVTVVCDGDYSGSFLHLLVPDFGKKRIVISLGIKSLGINSEAESSSRLKPAINADFSELFWDNIRNGENVRDAFLKVQDAASPFSEKMPQCLKLHENTIYTDRQRYYIENPDKLSGIL